MSKTSVAYVCRGCGAESVKWQGQCPQCAEWNTLEGRAVARNPRMAQRTVGAGIASTAAPLALPDPEARGRTTTGAAELDRVLGGGLVRGSVTLLGGDPGIGKSTLLLQVAAHCAATTPALYTSGEESVGQIGLRAERLGLSAAALQLLAETDLDTALEAARAGASQLLVIDSIQTAQSAALDSAAGGVSQLRECTAQLVRFAKTTGTSVVIIGHVTKEGAIAGPRVLEHLVDTVLYFESDASSRFRIVRATKNRFGPVGELAFFHMDESGLREVRNPSAIFLSRAAQAAPGSVVTVTRDGQRPLLVEIQALVDRMRFGAPRRLAQGLDSGRLSMLLAVMNRHAGVNLQEHDVFANVVGGLTIGETGSDLPLVLALASSLRDRALPQQLAAFGELGLTGELRPVAFGEERLREAAKQGFTRAIVPGGNAPRKRIEGLDVVAVTRVDRALDAAFE
ncbi:MAG TPA: DNA repair protein RadA [Steroidobacteraceae bacterium]|nr:DNA repair protein RadA [Steroidobacteraceae bacterium]HRX89353.1 DNA repair protein RadA [Steroidobacteraceae bacterium]